MKKIDKPRPSIIRTSPLLIQVCVPEEWNNEQIVEFANTKHPAGTSNGWMVVKDGHDLLSGDPERVRCAKYPNYIHVLLAC